MPTKVQPRLRDAKGHFVPTKKVKVSDKTTVMGKASVVNKPGVKVSPQGTISRSTPSGSITMVAPNKGVISRTSITIGVARQPKLNIYKDHIGEWRWSLVAGNGNIIADSSEGYVTKWGCKRAARKFLGI